MPRKAPDTPARALSNASLHWRCHRALISDALLARGRDVQHIMDAGLRPHALTPFARIVDGEARYDADDPQLALLDDAAGAPGPP